MDKVILFGCYFFPWFHFKNTSNFKIVKFNEFFGTYAWICLHLYNNKNSLFVFTDQMLRKLANWQIDKILNLLKKNNIKYALYFLDTVAFYKKRDHNFFELKIRKFDNILTYCESDAKEYNFKYVYFTFKYKNPKPKATLKYDIAYTAFCHHSKFRAEAFLNLINNKCFKQLKSFMYLTDNYKMFTDSDTQKYFKYKPIANSVSRKHYLNNANVLLYLKFIDDFPFGLREFCIVNNKKILTNSKVTYDLLNEPNKVRYIEDMSKFSEEDANWCKEIDNTPYSQHCLDLCDETKFAENIINIIYK